MQDVVALTRATHLGGSEKRNHVLRPVLLQSSSLLCSPPASGTSAVDALERRLNGAWQCSTVAVVKLILDARFIGFNLVEVLDEMKTRIFLFIKRCISR